MDPMGFILYNIYMMQHGVFVDWIAALATPTTWVKCNVSRLRHISLLEEGELSPSKSVFRDAIRWRGLLALESHCTRNISVDCAEIIACSLEQGEIVSWLAVSSHLSMFPDFKPGRRPLRSDECYSWHTFTVRMAAWGAGPGDVDGVVLTSQSNVRTTVNQWDLDGFGCV